MARTWGNFAMVCGESIPTCMVWHHCASQSFVHLPWTLKQVWMREYKQWHWHEWTLWRETTRRLRESTNNDIDRSEPCGVRSLADYVRVQTMTMTEVNHVAWDHSPTTWEYKQWQWHKWTLWRETTRRLRESTNNDIDRSEPCGVRPLADYVRVQTMTLTRVNLVEWDHSPTTWEYKQ